MHEDYYSKLMNVFYPPSWLDVFAQWIAMGLFIGVNLFVNTVLGTLVGVVTSWLFSHCFVGTWILRGFNVLGANVPEGDLYALGAAAGFISGFFKSPLVKKGA